MSSDAHASGLTEPLPLSAAHLKQCQAVVEHWLAVQFDNLDWLAEWNPKTRGECIDRLCDLDDMLTYWREEYAGRDPGVAMVTYRAAAARCTWNSLLLHLSHLTRICGIPLPHEEYDLSSPMHFRAACDEMQVVIQHFIDSLQKDEGTPAETLKPPSGDVQPSLPHDTKGCLTFAGNRIVLDAEINSVRLDGNQLAIELSNDAFNYFRLLCESYPGAMSWAKMKELHPFDDSNQERVKLAIPAGLVKIIEFKKGASPRIRLNL